MPEDNWSEWLDFKKENFERLPSGPGVFMMHQAMKILLIEDSDNLREKIESTLCDPCTSNATRFRYLQIEYPEKKKEDLLKDYQERHQGQLPRCMQSLKS